jgi:hypothetical protein
VQDGLQGLSGWQLDIGHSEQQHDVAASGTPAAHAGCGVKTPKAKTAIRTATKFLKLPATLEPLQDRVAISSLRCWIAGNDETGRTSVYAGPGITGF